MKRQPGLGWRQTDADCRVLDARNRAEHRKARIIFRKVCWRKRRHQRFFFVLSQPVTGQTAG